MVELKNVSKYYNNSGNITLALQNINLRFDKNEIVAITGESGSGKSTLLNIICGIDSYDDGEIYFNGNETSYFDQKDLDNFRRNNVAFIYQNYNIIDSYTTLENVMIPLIVKGMSHKEAKDRALELLTKVGLRHRIKTKGIKLSGGEKQRCVIARALASDCKILACDEPTGNLDSVSGKQIIDLIKEISKDKLVLIVTHNYAQVEQIATRCVKISDGVVVEDRVIQSVSSEEEKDMNMEETPITKKQLLKIGFYNLKNTPKKTFFTTLVFSFYAMAILFLLLTSIAWGERNQYTPNANFRNTYYNRLVAFNEDHSPIRKEQYENIAGEVFLNSFFEDYPLNVSFSQYNGFSLRDDVYSGVFTSYASNSIKHLNGFLPTKDEDIYVVLPEDMAEEFGEELFDEIGKYAYIHNARCNFNYELKLCGYGSSSEVSYLTFYTYKDYGPKIFSAFLVQLNPYVCIDGENVSVSNGFSYSLEKPLLTITAPEEPTIESMHILFKDIYNYSIEDYDIVYAQTPIISYYLTIPYQYQIDTVYEMSIYTDNVDQVKKELSNRGLYVIQPGKNGAVEGSKEELFLWLFRVISILTITILFFISYVIISRIYISKNKEYTILRSNGILKKPMARVVSFEIFSQIILASLLAFGVIGLLYFVPNENLQIITFVNFPVFLFYILVIAVIALLLVHRLNRRLFKLSVALSLKGEVMRND
ncbi:MAG: ABC transporter ATP-binding protein [Anaeroplasmataceae bacterium]|nr:ABC transporter ATP-binding protein [Anaeroplasmataceae bacterium]